MKLNFAPQTSIKFSGIEQQREYEERLRTFPDESLEKLVEINDQRDFRSHVELSAKYSKNDDNVRWVHEEVSTLVGQKRTEKNDGLLEQVKEKLADLRKAIDVVLSEFKN